MRFVTGMQFADELHRFIRETAPKVKDLKDWLGKADISETIFVDMRGDAILKVYSPTSIISGAFVMPQLRFSSLIERGLFRYKLGFARQLYGRYGFSPEQVNEIMTRAERDGYFLTADEAMYVVGEPLFGWIEAPKQAYPDIFFPMQKQTPSPSEYVELPEYYAWEEEEQPRPTLAEFEAMPELRKAYEKYPEMTTGEFLPDKVGIKSWFRTYEEKEDVKTEGKPKGLLFGQYHEVSKEPKAPKQYQKWHKEE